MGHQFVPRLACSGCASTDRALLEQVYDVWVDVAPDAAWAAHAE